MKNSKKTHNIVIKKSKNKKSKTNTKDFIDTKDDKSIMSASKIQEVVKELFPSKYMKDRYENTLYQESKDFKSSKNRPLPSLAVEK